MKSPQGNFISLCNKISRRISAMFMLAVLLLQFTFTPGEISAASTSTKLTLNSKSVGVTVAGYSSVSSEKYTFSGSLTYTFSSPADTKFNKFSISYYSNQAVKGVIYYTESSRSKSEEFFLEKNTSTGTFNSFTDNYLNNRKATKISKIVFTPLSSSTATVKINSITTTVADVYTDDTVYIENSRFKVGCCLIWGGGLNYIEDKKDGDASIGNMLNKHDTGRLVQQSYYGTTTDPDYECGDYNGTLWGYNPVQGGNLYGEKSKLIDCVVTDSYIYVKCRPRDWAKEGVYSYSYMENKYTLEENTITVDNRFIDFSGFSHGSPRHQELPAFYTISYLDKFSFYNGSKPWTDGGLTVKSNLGFWGDQANRSECYTDLKSGNTETWCAWTSSEKGYGIGLYTPGTEIMLAGRHSYNGSKSPTNDATNYVAPLKTYTMKNYTPYSYTYYITAGTVKNIRNVFKSKALNIDIDIDTGTGSDELDYTRITFDDYSQLDALSEINDASATTSSGAALLTGSSTPGNYWSYDMYAYVNYSMHKDTLSTSNYKYLVVTYKLPTTNKESSYKMEIFTCVGDQISAKAGVSLKRSLIKDGKYHSFVVNLSSYPSLWASGQKINKIRFDFLDQMSGGDKIYISEISLAKTEAEANKYAAASTSSATATATPTSTATAKPTGSSGTVVTTAPPLYTGGITTKPSATTGSATSKPTAKPSTNKPVATNKPANTTKPSSSAGITVPGITVPLPTEDIYANAEEYKNISAEIINKGNNTFADDTKIVFKKVSDTTAIGKTLTECFGEDIQYMVAYMTSDAKVTDTMVLSVTLPEEYRNNNTYIYALTSDGRLSMTNSVFTNGKFTFPAEELGPVVFFNTFTELETTPPATLIPVVTETPIPESDTPQSTPTSDVTATATATADNNSAQPLPTETDNEKSPLHTSDETDSDDKEKNIVLISAIIFIAAIIVIGAVIFLLLFLKKKKKKEI